VRLYFLAFPAKWAQNPLVVGFHDSLGKIDLGYSSSKPWVDRARTYRQFLMELAPPGRSPAFTHAILSDPNTIQRKVVDGLLAQQAGGVPFPDEGPRTPLEDDLKSYDHVSGRNDSTAANVGASVLATITNVLTASNAEKTEAVLAGLRGDLVEALGERQEILGQIRASIRQKQATLEQIRQDARRDVCALEENASEIARGLDALSVGLRRGHEAIYAPKNAVVSGLKSLASNLGELDILDDEEVERFGGKLDELSTKFDAIIGSRELRLMNRTHRARNQHA
jgi:hypothetical protein